MGDMKLNLGLSVKKMRCEGSDMMNYWNCFLSVFFLYAIFLRLSDMFLFLCSCVGITTCAEYTRFTDASLQLGFFEFCLSLFLKLLKFHCHSHVAGYLQFPREKSLLRVQLARHEVKQVRV